MFAEAHRIICRNKPSVFRELAENFYETLVRASMKRTNGSHINNFPVEQFHPRVRIDDSGLAHAVVLINREPMFCQHRHAGKVVVRKESNKLEATALRELTSSPS